MVEGAVDLFERLIHIVQYAGGWGVAVYEAWLLLKKDREKDALTQQIIGILQTENEAKQLESKTSKEHRP